MAQKQIHALKPHYFEGKFAVLFLKKDHSLGIFKVDEYFGEWDFFETS